MNSKASKPARSYLASKDISLPSEVRQAVAHVGLFSRVAEKLELHPSHVLKVAKGERKSTRVLKAIVREVRVIDRLRRVERGTA